MSIEKPPQQEECPDSMKAFREKVLHLIEDEKKIRQTVHFSSIDNTKEFLNSLNEDDMRWLDFTEEVQHATEKDPETWKERMHGLASSKVKEYQKKIEEFKQTQNTIKGPRSILREFIANKLNIIGLKLYILQNKRGKDDLLS